MNKLKGIIFDFNGTLFWDSKLHDEAWRAFAKEFTQREITDNDMKQHIYGRINRDILSFVFGKKLSVKEVNYFAFIKEEMYRNIVVSKNGLAELAIGAVEFLNFLKEYNIPRTIATSSNKDNVDFFFEHLKLDTWFNYSIVVMDQTNLNPKPAADIFLKAAENINLSPKDCMVIEDSFTGLKAAKNAQIGKIVYIENNQPTDFAIVKNLVDIKTIDFSNLYQYFN